MRRLFTFLACVLVFGTGWAVGLQSSGGRGSDWKELSTGEQVLYAEGFNIGYKTGLIDGHTLTLAVPPTGEEPWKGWSDADTSSFYADARARRAVIDTIAHRVTYGQIVNTVSDLYRDFRNTPICWDDAVIFSEESLTGHPPSDQQLAAARAVGARDCVQ